VELRDAQEKFREAGVALYAISYDDRKVLAELAETLGIEYPLLSDIDSSVIRDYGILNTQVEPNDGILYGIPYPGAYVTDEDGVVVEKFFRDSYKRRESAENLIEAALGRLLPGDGEPTAIGGEPEVRLTASLHGGGGTLKQGAQRKLVVRFELGEGLHVYGDPVPEGMRPTRIEVTGPPGVKVGEPSFPPTERLRIDALDLELPVWGGSFDVVIPVYATSELASECHPVERTRATLEVTVHYQACNDSTCLLPKSETLLLEVPVLPVDVQSISLHQGHGQRELAIEGERHLRRLFLRKGRAHPLGLLRFVWSQVRMELADRLRPRR